jgi:hypothetical protein
MAAGSYAKSVGCQVRSAQVERSEIGSASANSCGNWTARIPCGVQVAQRQVGRPPTSTAQDDQLLLEDEIRSDHRSHATGATQLRGHDSKVEQGEQEVLHARVSVGQTSGATQRCCNPGFSERIGNSRRTAAGLGREAARLPGAAALTHGRGPLLAEKSVRTRVSTQTATAALAPWLSSR